MRNLRAVTKLPIGVGFGISTPAQAREVAGFADAVVVGSAISQLIEAHQDSDHLLTVVGEFIGSLKAAMRTGRDACRCRHCLAMAEREPLAAPATSPADDLWVKCPGCREITFRKEVERNLNVCPRCGHHLRVTVEQRLAITLDRGTWHELFADLRIGDPLGLRGFQAVSRTHGTGPAQGRTQ